MSLVLICTVRSQLRSGLEGARAVRSGLSEVAAQADENLGPPFGHGMQSPRPRCGRASRGTLNWKRRSEGIEECHGWTFVDAHGPVALHVAVAAHRAQAGAWPTDVAAQQHQVGDFLDGRYRMAMLGDAHGPAHDDVLALGVHARGLFDFHQRQARLLDDLFPWVSSTGGQVVQDIDAVFIEEGVIEHRRLARFLCIAFPLQQELGHAAHDRHVAAQCRSEERGIGRFVSRW